MKVAGLADAAHTTFVFVHGRGHGATGSWQRLASRGYTGRSMPGRGVRICLPLQNGLQYGEYGRERHIVGRFQDVGKNQDLPRANAANSVLVVAANLDGAPFD